MKFNVKIIQLLLASIGFFLIIITYFYFPENKPNNLNVLEKNPISKEGKNNININAGEADYFQNVEYEGVYNINNFFTINSVDAYILKANPDEVFMTDMLVTLTLNSGKIVLIVSDSGIYNKLNYNVFFKDNVKATEGSTVILSDNLDLFADEDYALVYNNVILEDAQGSMRADQVNYDFEKEVYKVSMFTEDQIKVKVIE